jgi:hypothetical protein
MGPRPCLLIFAKSEMYGRHGTYQVLRGRITLQGVAGSKKGEGTHTI